jgi:lysophospholipase L1-like esterase
MRKSEIAGLPYQLRPDFSTLYYGHDVQINKQGFRGSDIPPRQPGLRRIALIGDSITFGHVASEDTLAKQLTSELKEIGEPAEVLNCGVSGYDAAHIAVMLEHQVLAFSPDVVVYVCCYNDGPEPGPVAQPEISPDQVLDMTKTFPLRSAFLEWGGRRTKAMMRMLNIGSSKGYVAGILDVWNGGGSDRFAAAIERMDSICTEEGIQLIVAFCPPMIHPEANPYGAIESEVEQICDRLDIDFLQLRQAFDESENLSNYQVSVFDSHPNAEANRHMASYMAQELTQ